MENHTLLIVIPGYGDTIPSSNIAHKKQIIDKNLDYFLKGRKGSVFIRQFNKPDMLYDNKSYETFLFYSSISLSEFLYDYITPEIARKHDYVVLILDDVEINSNGPGVDEVIDVYEKSGLDIISPSVKNATWRHMHPIQNPRPREVREVAGGIEFYCYLMRPKAYELYYNKVLVPWNGFMWGYDLVLEYAGIKTGVYDLWRSTHYYTGSGNGEAKRQDMLEYLRYFFKGGHVPDVFSRMGKLNKVISV